MDDAERAAVGGMIFPAALAPARDSIRGVLAGSNLTSGLVGPLRALFDDPQKVQAAAGVIGVVSALSTSASSSPPSTVPRPGVAVNPGAVAGRSRSRPCVRPATSRAGSRIASRCRFRSPRIRWPG